MKLFAIPPAVLCALSAAVPAAPQTMTIERDVVVSGMTSDRFTWRDASNQPRVAVLAHNTGQTGPGGTRGGELREFRYQAPGGTRIVRASGSAFAGFGYVVSHEFDASFCTGGGDPSSLGHFTPGTITRVFEGRHHAIFRFTQAYPRYCTTGAPAQQYNLPVTIEWMMASARDNPVWAVTWDMSGVPVNRLEDDARGPYGELLFDGSATTGAHSLIAGVAWGDRFKFTSTTNPVSYGSEWTWNVPNTIPYVKLWTTAVDATMGTVQTQTIVQQDAGGYWGVDRWGDTSASGLGCTIAQGGEDSVMPCPFNWPYQSINYEMNQFPPVTTNGTRLAWGTNFGFLGQAQYLIHGSQSYGGPLPDTFAPGHPRKSYSTHVVLGLHSSDPVGDQVAETEAAQATTLTAAIGTVATSGPAGVGRPDSVTYAPAGWNHVYGTWAVNGAAGGADVNFSVGGGRVLTRPVVVVSNWTAGTLPAIVRLNGVLLAQDVDYFPSVRASALQLWLTLGRNLTGGANRLEVLPQTGAQLLDAAGMTVDPPSAGGNGVLEVNEQAVIAPSWRNVSAVAQAFFGTASSFGGPAGPGYNLTDNFADFGSIAPGATGSCLATGNCYVMAIFGARPDVHWDASFLDTPNNGNAPALRVLHVGESFDDVPVASPFYRFVETLLHRGVTGGCGGSTYCPANATTREQMVVFVLVAKEGNGYAPPACVAGAEAFSDVPASSPYCRWIEELARRSVVGGCGGGAVGPGALVTRDQLAVFVLATREPPGYAPPACVAGGEAFSDVPASSPFCKWIEELARRGVVSGCGGGSYCPASAVTREQMGVFLAVTFGLTLY